MNVLHAGQWQLWVTPREFDTMLAALRMWQANPVTAEQERFQGIATEHGDALSLDEVDELCERLNQS